MTSPAQDSVKQLDLEKKAIPLWQLRALRAGVIRSCINCEHFVPLPTEQCELAPGQRPPANVIALGCDSWLQEIPF